jgi:transcriptional regulator with XRE-family HTH domain
MLQTSQIRAARALLGWRQDELAEAAKIGLATIARIEQGEGTVAAHVSTVVKIQSALEAKGITFIDDGENGYGVVLKPRR